MTHVLPERPQISIVLGNTDSNAWQLIDSEAEAVACTSIDQYFMAISDKISYSYAQNAGSR